MSALNIAELAAAVADVLDVPIPEQHADERTYLNVLEARTATLRGVMRGTAESGNARALVASVRWVAEQYPITYAPNVDETGGES